jgi:chromatin assembly factor 1 subunit A
MDDVISSPPAPNILKRSAPEDYDHDSPAKKPLNLKGSQFVMPTPPDTEESSNASPDVSINNDDLDRGVSPAPSSALSSILDLKPGEASTNGLPSIASNSGSGPPPAKRRKLTPAEKLEQSQLKEAKAREKAELKVQKDEEKARKDEEKRLKDEEKRKKAEEREAKKREKELEEQRKTQEKLNKERKQMRLGAFFQQTPTTPAKAGDGDEIQAGRTRRKSLSLEPYDAVAESIQRTASPMKGTPPPPASAKKVLESKPAVSDYHKTFLPFMLPMHCTIAPIPQASDEAQERFDCELNDPSLKEKYDLGIEGNYAALGQYFASGSNVARGVPITSVKELAEVIQGTSKAPIDLTEDGFGVTALDVLRRIPIRHLQFHEDVRPAYCGTYTKIKSPRTTRKLRRNPFTRARQDTNYDYDSEVEWEEPEEGDEEVLSEEEDEADSQADGDEIDGFLDDEDDTAKVKRKITTGELVPETTGLCWEGKRGRICVVESIETDQQPAAMSGMSIGILVPGLTGTIDPFSTAYWQDTAAADAAAPTLMAPPRAPLQPRLNLGGVIGVGTATPDTNLIGAGEGQKGPITTVAATQAAKRGPKPAPKTLSKEDLEEFKEAVIGSPVGKLELQKGLKTRFVGMIWNYITYADIADRFPKLTHEAIKETLGTLFAQRGLGKADKRWVFVGDT